MQIKQQYHWIKTALLGLMCIVLAIAPLVVGGFIGSFSPYVEGNSATNFLLVWAGVSILFVGLIWIVVNRIFGSNQTKTAGMIMICFAGPIIGISGLAAPPDLTENMLLHPEREHTRYLLLFFAAGIFMAFSYFQHRIDLFQINDGIKKLLLIVCLIVSVQFIWEFSHHYYYPEAMKQWIEGGGKADEFGKNYDNFGIVLIGAIGRLFQFLLIAWMAGRLYKLRKIRLWNPIFTVLLSSLGILSAIIIVVTEMKYPKPLEFLFLFFIPGILFLLLYWIGIAMVSRTVTNEMIANKI